MNMLRNFQFSKILAKISIVIFLILLMVPGKSLARDPSQITDWYIKDFQTEMDLGTDSTMTVVERITADCGNLPNKHGIFRILPTQMSGATGKTIQTPVSLISITNENGDPIKYTQTKSSSDHTITWKIGDADKTVTGVNYYNIKYKVKNVIRFDNEKFDEFYWNLSGAFWQLDIDAFSAKINFPSQITEDNTGLYLYTGSIGKQGQDATSDWSGPNQLTVESTKGLKAGEGVTLSATFPKNIISPYIPGFWEAHWAKLTFIFPLLALIICLLLWAKYGRDPKIAGPIVPEFEVPGKLLPMDFGEVITNGKLKSQFISAGIINLAVKKVLKIESLEGHDYKLILSEKKPDNLSLSEDQLIEKLFGPAHEVKISDLKNEFYRKIESLESTVKDHLKKQNLVNDSGVCSQFVFVFLAIIFFANMFLMFNYSVLAGLSSLLTAIIFVVFIFLIPKRTIAAVRMLKKIDGFKLYMKTAEKYRQQFNEKENIFEKYLPYAMIFGLTGLWIKKMKEIYGEEYFNTYHPVWFYGATLSTFNADSFDSAISGLSSNMSSTLASMPSSSGAGGGGFSGGGGGGGGGGGW